MDMMADADAALRYAICVRPAGNGRQRWVLLNDDGEAVLHGEASNQAAALSMARAAFAQAAAGGFRPG